MTQRVRDPAGAARLPAATLLAYGLPALPLAVLLLPLHVHLPAWYAEDLGLGYAWVGGIFLLARLWDMISDPLVGALSDRFPATAVRRKVWMGAGMALLLPAAGMLFAPGAEPSIAYLAVATIALYTGLTLVLVPYTAWGAELSPDYHERSRVAGAREVLAVVGTLVALGLPALFGAGRALSITICLIILLLGLPVLLAIALGAVPAGRTGMPVRIDRAGLAGIRRNGPFLRLLSAWILNGIANGLPATLFVLYVAHVLHAPDWTGPLLFTYFAAGVAGTPFWLWLGRRLGKHRAWCAAMIWTCAIFATVPLISAGDTAFFLVVCIGTGLGLGADLILPPAMQADVVDLHTARGGGQRTGLYFALWSCSTKLSLALAIGIGFPILDLVGLEPPAGTATTGLPAITLIALYAVAPIFFKLLAIRLVFRFPITAERQARLRRAIDARIARADARLKGHLT